MSAARKSAARLTAAALIEEAMHLLREAPAATLLVYYATAVPFVLGVLFFWAHVTWFSPAPASVAWLALGLTALFAVMKAGQADFCARLLAQRLGSTVPAMTWRRFLRLAAEQIRVQAWGLFLLPAAAIVSVPFGWVYAYFQNFSVLADDERAHDVAIEQAALWPGQNHAGLLFISLLGLCAMVNLGAAFWLVPWLANRLLGLENIFGLHGWWFANTTFLASVAALVWLVIDPLVKAFYTLRVFHGRARATGEDLRNDLARARLGRKAARLVGVAALVWAGILGPIPRLRAAAEPTPAVRTEQAQQLDRAIDHVLSGENFQWRLRPLPPAEDISADGPVKRFLRQGMDYLSGFGRWTWRQVKRAIDWISDLFPKGSPTVVSTKASSTAPQILRVVLYVLLAGAVLLIIGVIIMVWRRSRALAATVMPARAVAPAAPDLRDENTQAAQLPADGWLELARAQLAAGEWRLALRALQLASLARLAAEGLVSLAKSKTNLDYERELRRRALDRAEIVAAFSARRTGFEAVWYGRADPQERDVRDWLAELESAPAP